MSKLLFDENELKKMSVQELIDLCNKMTEERNYYRDKCNKILENKK